MLKTHIVKWNVIFLIIVITTHVMMYIALLLRGMSKKEVDLCSNTETLKQQKSMLSVITTLRLS